MKLFTRKPAVLPLDVLRPVPPSDTPIFARLAVEMPLPSWDDTKAVAA